MEVTYIIVGQKDNWEAIMAQSFRCRVACSFCQTSLMAFWGESLPLVEGERGRHGSKSLSLILHLGQVKAALLSALTQPPCPRQVCTLWVTSNYSLALFAFRNTRDWSVQEGSQAREAEAQPRCPQTTAWGKPSGTSNKHLKYVRSSQNKFCCRIFSQASFLHLFTIQ